MDFIHLSLDGTQSLDASPDAECTVEFFKRCCVYRAAITPYLPLFGDESSSLLANGFF